MLTAEQLRTLEEGLKNLWVLDDAELETAVEQIGQTGQVEQSTQADARGTLAGTLFSIEQACKLLRERLGVQLQVATQVRMEATLTDEAGNVISHSEGTETGFHPLS